jgi:hypothetical protein
MGLFYVVKSVRFFYNVYNRPIKNKEGRVDENG